MEVKRTPRLSTMKLASRPQSVIRMSTLIQRAAVVREAILGSSDDRQHERHAEVLVAEVQHVEDAQPVGALSSSFSCRRSPDALCPPAIAQRISRGTWRRTRTTRAKKQRFSNTSYQ